MENRNKLLLIFIIILFYILISFFFSFQKQAQIISGLFLPSSTPTPEPFMHPELAFSPRVFEVFHDTKEAYVSSAILKNDYEGTIVDLQQKTNTGYALIFRLRAPNDAENSFLFTKDQLKKVIILLVDKKNKTSLTVNQLKLGQFLRIHEEIDLKKDWPDARKQFVITITK
jgi:hypothetical protein